MKQFRQVYPKYSKSTKNMYSSLANHKSFQILKSCKKQLTNQNIDISNTNLLIKNVNISQSLTTSLKNNTTIDIPIIYSQNDNIFKNRFQRTPKHLLSTSKSKGKSNVKTNNNLNLNLHSNSSTQFHSFKYIKEINVKDINNNRQIQSQQDYKLSPAQSKGLETIKSLTSILENPISMSYIQQNSSQNLLIINSQQKNNLRLRRLVSQADFNQKDKDFSFRSGFQNIKSKKFNTTNKTLPSSSNTNIQFKKPFQALQSDQFQEIIKLRYQIDRLNNVVKQKNQNIQQLEIKIELLEMKQQTYQKKIKIYQSKSQSLQYQVEKIKKLLVQTNQNNQILTKQLKEISKKADKLQQDIKNDTMRKYLEQNLLQKQKIIFNLQGQIKSLELKLSCIQFKYNNQKRNLLMKKDQRICKLLQNNKKLQEDIRVLRKKKNKSEMLLDISISQEQLQNQ